MKEVEVKIKIADASHIVESLTALGCAFGEPIAQRDIVYIPDGVPTVPCPAGTNVLRIRLQGGRKFFTLKRSDPGNHLSKLEHELEISDDKQMDEIIKLLGFKIVADTVKMRQKCEINGYEICVDRVNELGDFLEMEKMTDGDPVKAQQEMLEYLLGLGIDASMRMDAGYDVLYVQKYGNAKI